MSKITREELKTYEANIKEANDLEEINTVINEWVFDFRIEEGEDYDKLKELSREREFEIIIRTIRGLKTRAEVNRAAWLKTKIFMTVELMAEIDDELTLRLAEIIKEERKQKNN